jgi:hypothetical protein
MHQNALPIIIWLFIEQGNGAGFAHSAHAPVHGKHPLWGKGFTNAAL